jgi:hydroxymethylbilane synthase
VTTGVSVRIGTRRSALAIVQAKIAADALDAVVDATQLVPIVTHGDRISARQPEAGWAESDGQFTRELEQALLVGEIDAAVHSYKDLPTAAVDGLCVAAVLPRADARDCIITKARVGLDDLPVGARVGTSSPRRAAQLLAVRPDIVTVPIRGNVETRIAHVDDGELDAVILAAAGLDRLGVAVPDTARLSFDLMLPAPAQGALAIEVRASDDDLRRAVAETDDAATHLAADAERALLRRVGGGCLAPLGAYAEVADGFLRLRAAYAPEPTTWHRADARGPVGDVAAVIDAAMDQLQASGAVA